VVIKIFQNKLNHLWSLNPPKIIIFYHFLGGDFFVLSDEIKEKNEISIGSDIFSLFLGR